MLNKRFSNNWSGSIDYTLQSAKGNASDPNAVADQRSDGVEPEVQISSFELGSNTYS